MGIAHPWYRLICYIVPMVGVEPTRLLYSALDSKSSVSNQFHHIGIIFRAPGKPRTCDLLITNQMLCQLSYWGLFVLIKGLEPLRPLQTLVS